MNAKYTRCRVYDPDAMNTMGWAFDKAFEGLSELSKQQPNIRQDLALCIIRLFDEGENGPLRLSGMALAIANIVAATDGKRVSNGSIGCSNTISVLSQALMGGPWPPRVLPGRSIPPRRPRTLLSACFERMQRHPDAVQKRSFV